MILSNRNQAVFAILMIATFVFSNAVLSQGTSSRDSVCAGDECFPTRTTIGDATVPLKGAAKFEYLTFDVYTAAFYAPESAETPNEVLADVPKRLVLRYHRKIKPKDIIKSSWKVLEDNPELDLSTLRERFDRINSWYVTVRKGDEYAVEYIPEKGTTLYLNGEFVGTIEGADFAAAYFGIWLSEYPLSDGYRDKLLTGSELRD